MYLRILSVKKTVIAAALVLSLAIVACNNGDDATVAPAEPSAPVEAVESVAAEIEDAAESVAAEIEDAAESMATEVEEPVESIAAEVEEPVESPAA
jgi:uncharacterized lipoprotein NlpE involved in copper resistance